MDALESSRSHSKRAFEENMDARDRQTGDDEEWVEDKRKHRSSRSQQHNLPEEAEEHDGGRRKSSGDRNDGQNKVGSLSRVGDEEENDDDDYESRWDSRSKIPRKNLDDRVEKRSSDGYRDKDQDGSRRRKDDDNEWSSPRKANESTQSRTRSKSEGSHGRENVKEDDKESRYSERKESIREKGYSQHDQERNPLGRRWDEEDAGQRSGENGHLERSNPGVGKSFDYSKQWLSRDGALESRNEPGETRSRTVELSGDKVVRSSNREESRIDRERSKNNHDRLEGHDEDDRPDSTPWEARLDVVRDNKQRKSHDRSPGSMDDVEPTADMYGGRHGDKDEKIRYQWESGQGSRDEVESWDRSINMDEDGHSRMRDRSGRELRHDRRSRTPERIERHHREIDDRNRGYPESDNERSISIRVKEREESYRDDRFSKGREGSWTDKNRERDGPKDYWKRSQARQDTREGENRYDHHKEWDSQRRELERSDNDKIYSHPGYRRDGRGRAEGRSSSSYRNANETDSIEIKPNMNFDFGREETMPTFAGRRNEVGSRQDFAVGVNDEEWGYPAEERSKTTSGHAEDLQERYHDDESPMDQQSGINALDSQSGKGRGPKGIVNPNRPGNGPSSGSVVQPPPGNNQGVGSFSRAPQLGQKGGRSTRGGRGRPNGRDAPRVGIQMAPMMAAPFGHLGLPPGPMQPLGPNLSHNPMTPIGPGVFIPPFPGPLVWSGPRGVDANMLAAVPPSLPPIPPPGPGAPRFAPNMGSGPNHGMYFNQPSPGRVPPNSGPGFNVMTPSSRGTQHDKVPGGWTPSRNSGPSGKGPSRGEQNDYSQNFVDTGARPQNFIRELELTSVVEDYPKLRELIQRKDEIVAKSSTPPMYFKCDLKEHILTPEFFGTKFDVILVDPPWEEYVHRAPGVTDNIDCWSFEEIQNLKIEAIADTPSFIFLWVGDGVGLEQGRQCLKKWGFRRCEDICWVKTNKKTPTSALRHDSHTLLQHSKEHCLMGIKGTVRRSTDGHIIHANIDTDIIIAEEPADASSTKKPDDMYRIIEHFALGRRRLELFGEDHNIRAGWLTVGKGLSSSNFNAEAYIKSFADKEGKVWQGGGGRNPPPDTPHLVVTTPEIEALRPKSPPPKNQQQQQSPALLPSGSSNNRRAAANSPQNPLAATFSGLSQDVLVSDPATPVPWASSMGGLRWPDSGHGGSEDKFNDGYAFNPLFGQAVGDRLEFDPHQSINMM